MISDAVYVVGFALCAILFILNVIKLAIIIFGDDEKGGEK